MGVGEAAHFVILLGHGPAATRVGFLVDRPGAPPNRTEPVFTKRGSRT